MNYFKLLLSVGLVVSAGLSVSLTICSMHTHMQTKKLQAKEQQTENQQVKNYVKTGGTRQYTGRQRWYKIQQSEFYSLSAMVRDGELDPDVMLSRIENSLQRHKDALVENREEQLNLIRLDFKLTDCEWSQIREIVVRSKEILKQVTDSLADKVEDQDISRVDKTVVTDWLNKYHFDIRKVDFTFDHDKNRLSTESYALSKFCIRFKPDGALEISGVMPDVIRLSPGHKYLTKVKQKVSLIRLVWGTVNQWAVEKILMASAIEYLLYTKTGEISCANGVITSTGFQLLDKADVRETYLGPALVNGYTARLMARVAYKMRHKDYKELSTIDMLFRKKQFLIDFIDQRNGGNKRAV